MYTICLSKSFSTPFQSVTRNISTTLAKHARFKYITTVSFLNTYALVMSSFALCIILCLCLPMPLFPHIFSKSFKVQVTLPFYVNDYAYSRSSHLVLVKFAGNEAQFRCHVFCVMFLITQ